MHATCHPCGKMEQNLLSSSSQLVLAQGWILGESTMDSLGLVPHWTLGLECLCRSSSVHVHSFLSTNIMHNLVNSVSQQATLFFSCRSLFV